MKRIAAIVVLIALAFAGRAQQLSQFTYFTYNYMQYNPAVVGTARCLDMKFGLRRQWKGFENAPTTGFMNLHGKIGKRSDFHFHGLGGLIESDGAGPFGYTNVFINYAYHTRLANKYTLASGIGVGFSQYTVDYANLQFENQIEEPVVSGIVNDFIFPIFNAGIWLYRSDRFFGLSVRSLNNKSVDGLANSQIRRHVTFANGYATRVTKELSFKPSYLINYVGKSKLSIDGQLMLSYKDMFDVGIGARSGHGISALFKIAAVNYITFAYAYDVTMNKIRYVAGSTHEIVVGIRACKELSRLPVPCAAYD
ncbi:MAG: PorP/SprF family type IX secretion system membrane protein [Flavobacteriales bacterium]